MKLIRHGDILLREVADIETNEKPVKKHCLAEGEVTGHMHMLHGSVIPFRYEDKDYIKAITSLKLRHQEHNEVEVPVGTYEIVFEREYDPFKNELRKVVD